MLTLVIDTSTERGVVALFEGSTSIFHSELPFGYQNAKFLISTLDQGFKQIGIKPQQLSLIVAGVGPGSYTGIRVGVMVAKTLSYSCQLPLIGLSTLEGFIPEQDQSFIAMIDAKISGAYLLKGIRHAGVIVFNNQPEVCALDKIHDKIGKGTTTIITPNAMRLKAEIGSQDIEWIERAPSTEQLLHSALEKFEKNEFTINGELDPIYLRKTQAELERGK